MMRSFISMLLLALLAAAFCVDALQVQQLSTFQSTTHLQSQSNRRDFLAESVVGGVASAAALTSGGPAANAASTSKSLSLPPIGLGCWAWGDSLFWGYNPSQDKDLNEVFDFVVDQAKESGSSVLLDTAELYGLGRSETLIGDFSKDLSKDVKDKVVVATKFAPYPFRTKPENVVKACEASVKRLGGEPIDLYQIHFPNAFANEAYWDGLAAAYDKGLVKSVGVSNYGVDALRACSAALQKRGIPLASNQIQYSLLYRFPEDNGLLQACQDLGVNVLSYSPLALGLLTGKYASVESVQQIKGPRKGLFEKTVQDPNFQSVLTTMQQVASHHDNANLAQVAINWCRAKGTIPIPGARNLRQIQSNYAALKWDLSKEEIAMLDKAATFYYNTPDVAPFPRQDKDTGLIMFDS